MIAKTVDIIMPVHNRWKMTKQTLDSLFANTDLNLFNLYVVDDGSAQDDRDKLAQYDKEHFMSVHFNETAIAPGTCRNQAAASITANGLRSKYLYFSDNDVYFTKDWLPKLLEAFKWGSQLADFKLIGGGCHPYLQTSGRITVAGSPANHIIGIKDAVSGYSQLMTWETWDEFGPFDETMRDAAQKIMGSEDWAFCQKIIKAGHFVGALEPEVVIHCGKTNTYGNPATGNETFNQHEGIIIE